MTTSPAAREGRLRRDAAWFASSSLVNAMFGVVSVAISARLVEPHALGTMYAVLALVLTPAVAIASPLGDAFNSVLPGAGARRADVVRHALRIFLVGSVATGLVAAAVAVATLDHDGNPLALAALVLVGVLVFGGYLLENALFGATGRAHLLLATTLGMNVVKVALLFVLARAAGWHSLELSVLLSAGVVVVLALPFASRATRASASSRPEDPRLASPAGARREFDRYIVRVFFVIFFSFAVTSITPLLVTTWATPAAGALIAISLPAVQALDLVGSSLATSLVVHASTADRADATSMARTMLVRSFVVVGGGAVVIGVAAPRILDLVNPTYRELGSGQVLAVLCAASVVRVGFTTWAGLQRARRDLRSVVVVSGVSAVVAVTGIGLLAPPFGGVGAAWALLGATCTLSLGAGLHAGFVRRSAQFARGSR